MITFQWQFPNCLLTLGIGTKAFISPNVQAGLQKPRPLELEADWKEGVFDLHYVPLPLFSGLLPLAAQPLHPLSASPLMKTVPVRPWQAHPEAKWLKAMSGYLLFPIRVKS